MQDLANKKVNDRQFAKRFSKNSAYYLKDISSRAGVSTNTYNSDKPLDKQLMKIIEGLADEEIAIAIQNNDVKSYLELMHEKGYLDNNATIKDYNNLVSDEDKKVLLKSIGLDKYDASKMSIGAVAVIFYVAVLAVSWVGVAYTISGIVNTIVAATVVAYAKVKIAGTIHHHHLSTNFDIYLLQNKDINRSLETNNDDIKKLIHDASEAYMKIFISEANKKEISRLERFILYNYYKHMESDKNNLLTNGEDSISF